MIWQQEDCHLQWMFHHLIRCVNSLYTCDQISDFIISVRVTWQMVLMKEACKLQLKKNSGLLDAKYSHLKSFWQRLLQGFEGVEKSVVIEIKVVFHMSDHPPPEKVSSKRLPVLPAVGETTIDQPCYQVSTLNHTSPPALVPKHLLHTCRQVVPYEHGRHSPGRGVQVFPRR